MTEKEKKEKKKLLKQFGDHLVALREEQGLTAAEFARKCFMERSTIARLEGGRTNPSFYVIKRLSEGLQVNLAEFFTDFK